MSYVTYKNRWTADYRFTVTTLDDPAIADLKEILVRKNKSIKYSRKHFPNSSWSQNLPTQGLRIRPRGPRGGATHDTPIENATHFDVYVRDYS